MSKRFFVRKSAAILGMIGALSMSFFNSCTKDNPSAFPYEDDTETWTMTIDVLDGSTGKPIKSTVQYSNREGLYVTDTTDVNGHISIRGNAAGEQSFSVAYSGVGDGYSKVVVTDSNGVPTEDDAVLQKHNRLPDKSRVVKLYPLTGAISGTVKSQTNRFHTPVAVGAVVVSLTYDNEDLENATPKTFETVTDTTGKFSFINIPVAAGMKVQVANKTINDIDFTSDPFDQPKLVAGQTIPVGTIQMSPVNGVQFQPITTAPSIVIGVNDPIVLKYTDVVDSLSSVTLSNDDASGIVAVVTKFSGNTITIDPVVTLTDGMTYTLRAYVSGAKGGDLDQLVVTVKAQGGGLVDVVASNLLDANKQAIGGFGLTQPLWFKFRDSVTSATASVIAGGNVVDVSVVASNDTVTVTPVGSWPVTSSMTIKVSANLKDGTAATMTLTNVATTAGIALVASNVMDQSWTVVNGLGYNESIKIKINKTIAKATASLKREDNDVNIPVTVGYTYEQMEIKPNENLETGKLYTLAYTITTTDNQVKSSSVSFTTAATRAHVVASNVLGTDGFGLKNVAVDISPWFKLSDSISSENLTVELKTGDTIIPTIITLSGDTVKIDPVKNLVHATKYSVKIVGKTKTGELLEIDLTPDTKKFTTRQATFVIASNVLTADGLGLKNVEENITLWYKLSDSISASNLEVTLVGGGAVAVTVAGDTVKVDPVANLVSNTSYTVNIKGKTTEGQNFSVIGIDNFKTRLAPYVVATNTKDASLTNDAINFPYYGEMWVKFSEALNPDVNKIAWAAATGTSLYGNPNSDDYNSTVRISGDTLFITPNPALVTIAYGATAGFSVNVTTVSGRTSGPQTFNVTYMASDLYVKWTNTKNIDGSRKETFGILDTIVLVSSKQLTAITGVSVGDLGGVHPVDITLDNIKLSATGDTIRIIPTVRMTPNTLYSIDFDVKRADGITAGTTGELDVTWKTAEGVRIISTNNRQGGLFRPFKVIGDSLVVEFSKEIDITKTFTVNNFVQKYSVTWSSGNKVATIKNVSPDTLNAGGFAALPYTDGAATAKYLNLNFTVTTTDGENQAALAPSGDNLDIHVEQGLWVESVSYIDRTDNTSPVRVGNGTAKDDIAIDANLTVVFNRALDTNAIKADAGHLYQNILTLHKHGAAVLLEFALTFSSDAKTMTINPKQNFENGEQYAVSFINVPAGLGSMNVFAGGAVVPAADKSLINNEDFEVVSLPIVDISALQCTMIADTSTGADRRLGYSPSAASYAGDVADNRMLVKVKQPVWNEKHQDSVSHYQFRYRKKGSQSWYIDGNLQGVVPYSSFHAPAVLAANEWQEITVDIDAGYQLLSYMLTADQDKGGTDFTNGNHWLNDSTVIELQVRPVFDSDNDGNLATGEQSFGKWSAETPFADDIAPGDSTFGITGVAQADDADMNGTTGDAINWDNFSAANATAGIVVTFPEDMDVSFATTPSITFYNGLNNVNETAPSKLAAPASRWLSGRNYLLAVSIPAGTNYNDNVEFSEMAEGATTKWTLNAGLYPFVFSGFAGIGPNAAPINDGIYNGANVMGTQLTDGFYSEGATDMTVAAYDLGGASEDQGTYILRTTDIDVDNYLLGNVALEFEMLHDLEAGDQVDLEGDLDGDNIFETLLDTYTGQVAAWTHQSTNINAARGNNDVKIRFRLRADASSPVSTGHGFFIDNLRIRYVGSDSWYYSINVNGMKDASGVVCQPSGSVGDAQNSKAYTGVLGAATGNKNVSGLKRCD